VSALDLVRFNLCTEVPEQRIFNGAYVAIAGIVHEDVPATEGVNRGIDSVI